MLSYFDVGKLLRIFSFTQFKLLLNQRYVVNLAASVYNILVDAVGI